MGLRYVIFGLMLRPIFGLYLIIHVWKLNSSKLHAKLNIIVRLVSNVVCLQQEIHIINQLFFTTKYALLYLDVSTQSFNQWFIFTVKKSVPCDTIFKLDILIDYEEFFIIDYFLLIFHLYRSMIVIGNASCLDFKLSFHFVK